MAYTVIPASESTGNVSSSQQVRDVGKGIAYVDSEITPLTVFLMRSKSGTKADNRTGKNKKREWIEKEMQPPQFDQVDGAHTTGDTVIAVDNGDFFRGGDIVKVLRTGEVWRVSSVSSDNLTVVRSLGDASGTAATTINADEDLRIIGDSAAEMADVRVPRSYDESYVFNMHQIHRTELGYSGTKAETENYTGPVSTRLRKEKAFEHRLKMELSLIAGERSDDLGTAAQPNFVSGGLLYFLTSNNKTSVGTLTEPEVEDWAQDVFLKTGGGKTRLWVASPLQISVIDQLAAGRLQMVPSDTTFGIEVNTWKTGHGRFNIVEHPLLIDGAGGNGWGGLGFAIEPSRIRYVPYRNRDTKLLPNRQAPGVDGRIDEYLTECTWEIKNPAYHGTLEGVTG